MGIISTLLVSIFENPITSISTLLISFFTYYLLLYPFYLSPFKDIPGPYLYKISKLFILNDQRIEQRNEKLNEWHKKYGSVIQISPNELSLGSLNYLKEIYITKNLPKTQFYGNFTNYDNVNAFSTLDSEAHIKRKKLMTKLYTKTAVFNKDSSIHLNNKINNAIGFIEKTIDSSIDVYDLFNALAMDVVTWYELGPNYSTNLINEDREIIKAFRASSSTWFWTTLLPQFWDYAIDSKTKELSKKSANWTRDLFLKAYDDLEKNIDSNNDLSLIKILYLNGFSKWSIGSEIFDHVAAGHETTGASLAFATWELSRSINFEMQDKIYNEMCHNFGSTPIDYIDLEKLDKLEYLNAFILELERLHAAIPGSEPREISSKDKFKVKLSNDKEINLPKGTIVSVQPWTIHNDTSIFIKPELFKPERWLKQDDETDEEFRKRFQNMKNRIFTFGHGNRMCLGMNIAVIEMKLIIAQIYWRFNSKISLNWCSNLTNKNPIMGYKSFNNKSKLELNDVELMSMADSYTSRPMFDECWLEFKDRSK